MLIYMTHPHHGAKHAMEEAEAKADEVNGWTRTEMPKRKIRKVEVSSDQARGEELRGPGTPKRGRPPKAK